MRTFFHGLILVTLGINNFSYAKENDTLVRTTAVITKHHPLDARYAETKEIYLNKANLTPQQFQDMLNYKPKHHTATDSKDEITLPRKALINMSSVPVLDQGKLGTCATFAATAALDVLIGKGDYISQLCNLALGKYIESVSNDYYSGWKGTYIESVLDQIMQYGFINKDLEKNKICGGLASYPENPIIPFPSISAELFHQSQESASDLNWYALLSRNSVPGIAREFMPPYERDTHKVLMQVKYFIATTVAKTTKKPIGIATFSMVFRKSCTMGACARHNELNDTWAITKETKDQSATILFHALIITGYDDDAIATDAEGNVHKGLLYVRNSHGTDIGDHGDFYMTYDYFEKFTVDVELIYRLFWAEDFPIVGPPNGNTVIKAR